MLDPAIRRQVRNTLTVTLFPARRRRAAAPDGEGRFAEDGYLAVKRGTNFVAERWTCAVVLRERFEKLEVDASRISIRDPGRYRFLKGVLKRLRIGAHPFPLPSGR